MLSSAACWPLFKLRNIQVFRSTQSVFKEAGYQKMRIYHCYKKTVSDVIHNVNVAPLMEIY